VLPPAGRDTYVHEGERTFGHDDRFEVGDAEALWEIMLARVFLLNSHYSPERKRARWTTRPTHISNDENQTHSPIQHNRKHDHARHTLTGVIRFLGQMDSSIRTRERTSSRDGADKTGSSDTRPSAEVVECAEDFTCWRFWSEDPERDDDAEETKDVHDQDNALEDGEVFGAVGVHEGADDADADHEEGLVPASALVW
jgi:hypothetical protein